jgi:hypothetical protein
MVAAGNGGAGGNKGGGDGGGKVYYDIVFYKHQTNCIMHLSHLLHLPHLSLFLWGGKTCCALIATPNVDNANK